MRTAGRHTACIVPFITLESTAVITTVSGNAVRLTATLKTDCVVVAERESVLYWEESMQCCCDALSCICVRSL